MFSKRTKWALGVLIAGAVVLSGCAAAVKAGSPVGAAQADATESLRTVSVSGRGRAMSAPDIVYIILGVESRDVDAAEAIGDNTTRMQAVMAALESFGLTERDVQTVNYSMWLERTGGDVRPLPDVTTAESAEERYIVANQVRVALRDLDRVGEVLQEALEAGANSVGGIQFSVEDTEALRQQARLDAIADATAKAEQLAAGFDVQVGRVHSISEYGGTPEALPAGVRAVYGMGGADVPISGGELAVTVEVQVTFELAD